MSFSYLVQQQVVEGTKRRALCPFLTLAHILAELSVTYVADKNRGPPIPKNNQKILRHIFVTNNSITNNDKELYGLWAWRPILGGS
jgi:hypothetical protein